jgi:hypothetical protein
MFRKDVPAEKLGAIFHQPQECVFPVPINERHVLKVDGQLPALELRPGTFPGTFNLGGPWTDKSPFQNQCPTAWRVDDGNPEHWLIRPAPGKCKARAKRVQFRVSRK